ncbi:hypothetical protein THASP1DRAFT_23945 [Thamnocephalis sphaerospora]|uniref:Uncharacterized protein n=1 Tax=Thamnocephalis sphaerospora TaxID=78915 RepID=A0A4P9XR47_9FUNG|nr:hypothetical protein THASP1DRAFT_23945 [Thamnocephalis sphaerospora]|eukprot:RKP07981.1 hypothetical protein THASP1DRAFT_23945 [Thamnocephalis sphaerospora]
MASSALENTMRSRDASSGAAASRMAAVSAISNKMKKEPIAGGCAHEVFQRRQASCIITAMAVVVIVVVIAGVQKHAPNCMSANNSVDCTAGKCSEQPELGNCAATLTK